VTVSPGPGTPVRVCSASDLTEESAFGVEIGGEAVCVVRSAGRFFALRDECSHAEVALSEGEVEDGKIECWLHGSQFDLVTGKPTSLPAIEPVPTYAVTVDGDDVYVDLTPTNLTTNSR
jgi:3-phenylpropionate/trans-cinnamate dioxygenase ferredoxin subunit